MTYSREAAKVLRKMPRDTSRRILGTIYAYTEDPTALTNDVKPLTGNPGYRLRVGDWRILLLIDAGRQTLHVTRIGPRGGVYK